MVQVHCRWMTFIRFIRYMSSAARSPCDGYSPGEAAVQRMKRQPSVEVTTMLIQCGDEPVEGQAPDDLEQRRHAEISA